MSTVNKESSSHWVHIVLLAGVVLALVAPSLAFGRELAAIKASGVLRVGTSGDYAPFSLCRRGENQCEGFDIELSIQMAEDLGARIEFVRFKWPALLEDLAADKFDLAMSGITVRPERALRASFTRPYARTESVAVVADLNRFPDIGSIDEIGVRLAVNAGGHLEQVARSRFPRAKLLTTTLNRSLPAIILSKNADALLTDSLEVDSFLNPHPELHALPSFGNDSKAILMNSSNVDLRKWTDEWLLQKEVEGYLTCARRTWLGSSDREYIPLRIKGLLSLLDIRFALMRGIAEYKRMHGLPIEDRARESIVLEEIESQIARSVPPPLSKHLLAAAEDFFSLQIELAKRLQKVSLNSVGSVPRWAKNRRLRTELRPAISGLNRRITEELLDLRARRPFRVGEAKYKEWTNTGLTTSELSEIARARIGTAMWKVVREASEP